MMDCIVDCSFVASLVLGDEDAADAEELIRMMARSDIRCFVPSLFWTELSNVLVMAERRGRITSADAERVIVTISELPFVTVNDISSGALLRVNGFARKYKLTAYDAVYLELADRRQAVLKSYDKDLLKAAKKLNVI